MFRKSMYILGLLFTITPDFHRFHQVYIYLFVSKIWEFNNYASILDYFIECYALFFYEIVKRINMYGAFESKLRSISEHSTQHLSALYGTNSFYRNTFKFVKLACHENETASIVYLLQLVHCCLNSHIGSTQAWIKYIWVCDHVIITHT